MLAASAQPHTAPHLHGPHHSQPLYPPQHLHTPTPTRKPMAPVPEVVDTLSPAPSGRLKTLFARKPLVLASSPSQVSLTPPDPPAPPAPTAVITPLPPPPSTALSALEHPPSVSATPIITPPLPQPSPSARSRLKALLSESTRPASQAVKAFGDVFPGTNSLRGEKARSALQPPAQTPVSTRVQKTASRQMALVVIAAEPAAALSQSTLLLPSSPISPMHSISSPSLVCTAPQPKLNLPPPLLSPPPPLSPSLATPTPPYSSERVDPPSPSPVSSTRGPRRSLPRVSLVTPTNPRDSSATINGNQVNTASLRRNLGRSLLKGSISTPSLNTKKEPEPEPEPKSKDDSETRKKAGRHLALLFQGRNRTIVARTTPPRDTPPRLTPQELPSLTSSYNADASTSTPSLGTPRPLSRAASFTALRPRTLPRKTSAAALKFSSSTRAPPPEPKPKYTLLSSPVREKNPVYSSHSSQPTTSTTTPMSSPPAGLNQSSSSSLPQQRASVAGSRTSLNPSYTSLALSLSQTSLLIPESSSRSQVLPKDHYHLRFASSYVINLITPTLRTVHFSRSERNIDLKRITEERLALLSRMERTWGTSWADAASDLLNGSESAQSLEVKEAKLRACNITATAKARERKVFVSAMRDGILFCFLFNRLFPSQPASIQRVKVPKDDVRVAANISRFLDACREIGVGESDMFCLEDLDENSPVGLARVSRTILILANMAPPAQAPPKHRSSRSGLRPISGATDASSSAPSSKNASRPESPRYQTTATRGLRERPLRSSSSDLHARLQKEGTSSNTSTIGTASSNSMGPAAAAAAVPAVPPVPDSSKGPTSPLSHFSHSSYSATPPLSPVRPSATSTASQRTSGSGSHTPSSSRPQRIASSKTQVSFKSDGGSPHVSGQDWSSSFSSNHSTTHLAPLHERERTPSLVSNNSQIASSYSRSSVRGSEPTILNDDSQPVDEFERHIEGAAAHTSLNEGPRRISEQTLQEARRKIIGTLLSSTDDLHRGSSLEEARGFALSQSLAALEGSGKRADSPRLRPGPLSRSTTSQGNETPQDGSTTAEDGNGSSDPSPPARPLSELPPRPRIRRSSHNGKMYVPKRTNSPASPNLSLVAGISPPVMPIPIDPAFMNGHVTSKEERRKSEDLPNGNVASSGANKIMNMRNHSMINLPATSRQTSNPSHKSIDSVVTPSLQILRFGAPGQLPTKYQLGNCIGRGQFGSVYRSLNLSTGQMVAIKRIRLSGLKEAEVSDVMREVELLQRLSHPGIVKYEGMSRDDAFLNIVLEFVENGSLGQTLRAFGKFNERLVASYVAKILEGLNYLHSEGVVHCDLKAANILSTKNGNIKLSDFGVSLNMRAVEHFAERTSIGRAAANDGMRSPNEVAGTPNWMAPEVIKLQGASPKSDIWSLGCTIVELLTGKPPYSDLGNSMTVLFRIVEDPVPPVPHSVSPELKDFLTLCFTKNPENRPSAALLFEHEWVKIGHPDLIQRPQDSLPFLRRLSHEPNHRALSSQSLFQAGKRSASASLIDLHEESRIEAEAAETRRRAQLSMVSLHSHLHQSREGLDSSAAKAHALVKTTFAKSITCHVCLEGVKKAAYLCQNCGLITHAKCAPRANARCDVRGQLALLASQQDWGVSTTSAPSAPSAPSSRPTSPQLDSPGLSLGSRFWGRNKSKSSLMAGRSTTSLVAPEPTGSGHRRSSAASSSSRPYLDALTNSVDPTGSFNSRHSDCEDALSAYRDDAVAQASAQAQAQAQRDRLIRIDEDGPVLSRTLRPAPPPPAPTGSIPKANEPVEGPPVPRRRSSMRFRSTLKKDKHDKADKVKSATNAIQEEEDETRSDCVVM